MAAIPSGRTPVRLLHGSSAPTHLSPSVAEGKAPVLRVTRNAQYRDIDGGRIASFCPLALRSATPSKPFPSKPVSASVYADQCRKLTAKQLPSAPRKRIAGRYKCRPKVILSDCRKLPSMTAERRDDQ